MLLACPVAEPAALRRVTVSARADAHAVSVRALRTGDASLLAGGLLEEQPLDVSATLERLSVGRPRLFGAPPLLGALGLSLAALAGTASALARVGGRPAESVRDETW